MQEIDQDIPTLTAVFCSSSLKDVNLLTLKPELLFGRVAGASMPEGLLVALELLRCREALLEPGELTGAGTADAIDLNRVL